LQTGCQQEAAITEKPETTLAKPETVIQPKKAQITESKPQKGGPKIVFEKEIHNLGEIGPGTKNVCEFRFTNTGDSMLKIKKVSKTCSCTPFTLEKREYAPGESGTVKITYHASRSPGAVTRRLYVYSNDETKFCWGTVMNHVILHQTVIGLEAKQQMRRANASPDILIAAVSGGSAFGGLVFPFYHEYRGKTRMIAVETAASPSLSKGRYAYDYADSGGLSLMLKMYTLGHGFIQPGIRAGGMRYHGISPLVSALYREKQVETKAYTEQQAFEAAVTFARLEGVIPSLECSYAVKAVIDEALACKENKERKNILFVLDANSRVDLDTFKDFLEGGIVSQPFLEERVQAALEQLPQTK